MTSIHGPVDAKDSKEGVGHHIHETQENDSGASSCRVCMESSEETTKLISPCKCSGTQQFIHFNCLKKWIEHSKYDVCGVCKEKYHGLTMTASAVPFSTFFEANRENVGRLIYLFLAVMIGNYVSGLTSLPSEPNDNEMWSIFKYDVNRAFSISVLAYLHTSYFRLFFLVFQLINWTATHGSFKVTAFEDKITREVIQSQQEAKVHTEFDHKCNESKHNSRV